MALLRLFVVLFLMTLSALVGGGAVAFRDELEFARLHNEITRLHEEIAGYKTLADKTTAMSDKSLVFAQNYQAVLITCLTRLYGGPAAGPVVVLGKGGIGGPDDVRRTSRLP